MTKEELFEVIDYNTVTMSHARAIKTAVEAYSSASNKEKQSVSRRAFKCSKCAGGVVVVITKETKDHVSTKVKKCSVCKYQWGLKQILSHGDGIIIFSDNTNEEL